MLWEANLSVGFWGECISTAVRLINISIASATPGTTPYEKWHGTKPSIHHLQPFGCTAYVHIPKDKRTKLDSKAWKGTFLRYQDNSKAYRIWDPAWRKVYSS